MNRRKFIAGSAVAVGGAALLYDPVVRKISNLTGKSVEMIAGTFSQVCEILRPDDLLHLRYYFINLTLENSKLNKIKNTQNAYFIIRLPQQHIGEEIQGRQKEYSKSFISGYSFLTFKVRKTPIDFTADTLNDWNKFDLLTLQDLETYPEHVPVELKDGISYPLNGKNFPSGLAVVKLNDLVVPVTLFEAPYKMVLSPISPCLRPERDTDYRYQFERTNKPKEYSSFSAPPSPLQYKLFELWNNNLLFQITSPNGKNLLPPNFKVVAFEETPEENVAVLPDPTGNDRENLARLTNLQEPNRDVVSDYFNISSLGASSYLRYFNLDEKNMKIVGWKQQFTLGRDNYVEIAKKAIDMRSTLKLLLLEIAERRIENGKSSLQHRLYFKYLETEKDFSNAVLFGGHLCTKIIALSPGTFVKDPKDFNDGFSDENSFIAYQECDPPGSGCDNVVVKMPYLITDQNGEKHTLQIDVVIIRKFAKGTENTLFFTAANVQRVIDNFHVYVAQTEHQTRSEHVVVLNKEKIGYAPDVSETSAQGEGEKRSSTTLPTDELQFYSVFNTEESLGFEGVNPLLPRLLYARVYIPQLEGIEAAQKARFVSYSKDYIHHQFDEASNKTKTFLLTLADDFKIKAMRAGADAEAMISSIAAQAKPIENIFTKNYRSGGGLINPDIRIDNISALQQSLSLTENLNNLPDIRNVRPADILRGLNTEIFGGIDLKKILKSVLPIEDSPIFEIIEEAKDGYDQFMSEIQEWKNKVATLPDKIRGLEVQIRNSIPNELQGNVKGYIDKFLTIKGQLRSFQVRSMIKVDLSGFDVNLLAKLGLETKINSTLPEVLGALEAKLGEKAEIFFTVNDSIVSNVKDFLDVAALKKFIAISQVLDVIEKAAIEQFEAKKQNEFLRFKKEFKQSVIENNFLSSTLEALKTKFRDLKNPVPTDASYEMAVEITRQLTKRKLLELSKSEVTLPPELLALMNNWKGWFITNGIDFKDNDKIILNDNFRCWSEFLNSNAVELVKTSETYYKALLDGYNEITLYLKDFISSEEIRINYEFSVLTREVRSDVEAVLRTITNDIERSSKLTSLRETYLAAQGIYQEFIAIKKKAEYLRSKAPRPDDDLIKFITAFELIEPIITARVRTAIDDGLSSITGLNTQIQNEIIILQNDIDHLILDKEQEFRRKVAPLENKVLEEAALLYLKVDEARQKLLTEVAKLHEELEEAKIYVKDFLVNKLREIEIRLKDANKELIEAYKLGEEAVREVQKKIDLINQTLATLKALNKKEFRYTWSTDKFDDVDFGIIKFLKSTQTKTKLKVEVKNTIRFNITQLPPTIQKVENYTESKLSDFKIDFLGILQVDFNNISFVGGTDTKEKFDVAIRDVRFGGPLNFVQAFQEFLKTLDKGLRFDISAEGAMLGYELPLPDIAGGVFNFVKAKLQMDLRLPFKAGVPMRFQFGLNSPSEMFLITAGIFGGRGCFQLAVEPKRGIVMIRLVIEFGAVLYLQLGPASGMVYLFAGIYIMKEDGRVEIRGYITCGGSLNILGLIIVSVTFYLGLRGNGTYMEGYCTLNIEIKICAFIKISVGIAMYKRVYGAQGGGGSQPALQTMRQAGLAIDPISDTSTDCYHGMTKPQWDKYWDNYFEANYHKLF